MNAKVIFDLVTSATTYSAGDCVGSCMKVNTANFAPGADMALKAVTVQDLDKQTANMSFLFFDSDPTATTFTDNSALDIADSDLWKVYACLSMPHTAYVSLSDNHVATYQCDIPVSTSALGGLCMAVKLDGGPTYATPGALKINLLFE